MVTHMAGKSQQENDYCPQQRTFNSDVLGVTLKHSLGSLGTDNPDNFILQWHSPGAVLNGLAASAAE